MAIEMRGITRAVFLFLIYSFVSNEVGILFLYFWKSLLQYNQKINISAYVTDGLLSSIPFMNFGVVIFYERSIGEVIRTVYALLKYIVIVWIIHLIVQAVIRRRRLSKTLNTFLVVSFVSCTFFISWLIAGFIHALSVIMVLMLCTYTFIAMISARTTIGRSFMANPIEFNQGKLNPIIINMLNLLFLT